MLTGQGHPLRELASSDCLFVWSAGYQPCANAGESDVISLMLHNRQTRLSVQHSWTRQAIELSFHAYPRRALRSHSVLKNKGKESLFPEFSALVIQHEKRWSKCEERIDALSSLGERRVPEEKTLGGKSTVRHILRASQPS